MRILGGENWVFLTQPEHVRQLFTLRAADASTGENNRTYFELITGVTSVMALDGEAHLARRRLLLPSMQGERMQAYAADMRTLTLSALGDWPRSRPFALQPCLQALTLEIVMRAIFGVTKEETQSELARLVRRVAREVFGSPFLFLRHLRLDWGPLSPWGRIVRLMADADYALLAEIAKRRKSASSDQSVVGLLLAVRDEQGVALTDREIRDELMTFLFAGHETTAASLAWAFERVLSLPAVTTRIKQELDAQRDTLQLPYLDAVIRESLRARPILPATGTRRLLTEMMVADHRLPAGTVVGVASVEIHNRPEIYSEPDRFVPERFLGKVPDPFSWVAFGGEAGVVSGFTSRCSR